MLIDIQLFYFRCFIYVNQPLNKLRKIICQLLIFTQNTLLSCIGYTMIQGEHIVIHAPIGHDKHSRLGVPTMNYIDCNFDLLNIWMTSIVWDINYSYYSLAEGAFHYYRSIFISQAIRALSTISNNRLKITLS